MIWHERARRQNRESGFILVTIALVILVLGIAISAYLYAVAIKRHQTEISRTDQAFSSVMHKLANYVSMNGHLPCPAARDRTQADEDYGVATDCTAQTVAPNMCEEGYCVATRNGQRVRIGIVPFATLKIPREDVTDAHGNFLTYALTERQGTNAYSDGGGVIGVVERDENGASVTKTVNFVLVSHGKDGSGAWRADGTAWVGGCNEPHIDGENCDGDAVFVRAPRSLATGSDYYDDQVEFVLWDWTYIWDFTYRDKDGSYSRGGLDSYIGVGTNDPKDKLHVGSGGHLKIENGALVTKALCNAAGDGCFNPEALGGDVTEGKGMRCPSNAFMTGIRGGKPVCGSIFSISNTRCPEDSFVTKVTFSLETGFTAVCVNALSGANTGMAP